MKSHRLCIIPSSKSTPLNQAKIIKLVDISYGGENGFNQVGFRNIILIWLFWV